MVCAVVPFLLKLNFGVFLGVLGGSRSDAPFFLLGRECAILLDGQTTG
jgi:hypothetical protein